MKGRIDRPGQKRNELDLIVLMAEGTVEEAEAANIRLCGTFFRHYISPHSRQFEQIAIDANLSTATAGSSRATNPSSKSRSSVQSAFRKGLALLASTPTDAAGRNGKKRSAGADAAEDDGDFVWEDADGERGGRAPDDAGSEALATPISTPMTSPAKKAKGAGGSKGTARGGGDVAGGGLAAPGTAPWLAAERGTGLVPRKLAYDLSELPPAVLNRDLLKKAALLGLCLL